jgi:hypothetical protein
MTVILTLVLGSRLAPIVVYERTSLNLFVVIHLRETSNILSENIIFVKFKAKTWSLREMCM